MVILYALIGAFCLGLAPLFGKTAVAGVNPITAFTLRTVIAAVLVMAWFASSKGMQEFSSLPGSFWLIITVEAILAALLGDLAYFYALKQGNINEVSLIMSCAPLFTITLSYFCMGEVVTRNQLVGALFITIGLVFISWD